MADASFDVVIVGGGNKALIAAMYLARYAKLEVGIFEVDFAPGAINKEEGRK